MNSSSTKVHELTKITVLLGRNKCAHYDYEDVLNHLNMKVTPPLPNLSFQEEQTLEKLLLGVFHEEKSNPDNEGLQCKGCNYASLIIEVLRNRKSLRSIVSTLCKN